MADLEEPILLSLPLQRRGAPAEPLCVWWAEEEGRWAADGCTVAEARNGSLLCACTHLTAFRAVEATAKQAAQIVDVVARCMNIGVLSEASAVLAQGKQLPSGLDPWRLAMPIGLWFVTLGLMCAGIVHERMLSAHRVRSHVWFRDPAHAKPKPKLKDTVPNLLRFSAK